MTADAGVPTRQRAERIRTIAYWTFTIVVAAFTLGSWALRPLDRRWQNVQPSAEARPHPRAWATAPALLLVMLVTSYFTMPKGPPPGY